MLALRFLHLFDTHTVYPVTSNPVSLMCYITSSRYVCTNREHFLLLRPGNKPREDPARDIHCAEVAANDDEATSSLDRRSDEINNHEKTRTTAETLLDGIEVRGVSRQENKQTPYAQVSQNNGIK